MGAIDDVVEVVTLRGGVMRRSRLPTRAVRQSVSAGRLVVPRRGLVALPELDEAVLHALRCGGVLSCASAAAAHGLEVLSPVTQVHVTVPRGVHPARAPGVVVHRRDVPVDGYATSLARAAADCTRCLEPVPALVVVESALRAGVTTDDVLAQLTGRGSGAGRRVVEQADPRSGSGGETVARVALTDAGLEVASQVAIAGVGRVDLLVEGRLVVEVDGYAYHSDYQQFSLDRRRDAALLSLGLLVVRFTWRDVVRDPQSVVATVKRILGVWA